MATSNARTLSDGAGRPGGRRQDLGEFRGQKAIERLLASVAHELRNPAEAIGNALYLLRRNTSLDLRAREYVDAAQFELERLAQITTQMLQLYRESPTPSSTSLAEVLDTVLAFYSRKIEFKQITIEKHYDSPGEIQAFPGQMRQLFTNLIVNALEAAPRKGRVRLHLAIAHDAHQPRAGFRVTIGDDGPGIGLKNQDRIFQSAFSTKGDKGSGLGLWISHGIVQGHNGSIRFRSSTRAGRNGTVFSVFLPQGKVQPAAGELGIA